MKKFTIIKLTIFAMLLFTLAANAQDLKVMTYNIRLDVKSDGENSWSNRKDFFSSQIKFYKPAIFGVQEAMPNQISDLTTSLPEYDHIGIGRDGVGKGEASAIFFDKSRFKVSNEQTFWLSETPEKISKGWDAAYIRICTYALFKDNITKRTFWVFNTHLDNKGEVSRKNGINLVLAKMKEVNKNNYPVILMGDFNVEPDSELITDLKKSMFDTREISEAKPFGPGGTFNGFKFDEPVTRLIDYIFVDNSKQIKVKKYAILSDSKNLKYPSDHLPVYVELIIGKK